MNHPYLRLRSPSLDTKLTESKFLAVRVGMVHYMSTLGKVGLMYSVHQFDRLTFNLSVSSALLLSPCMFQVIQHRLKQIL